MIYTFKCKKCDTQFDIEASWNQIAAMKVFCPVCKNDKVHRKYNVPSISFKGGGFYSSKKEEKNELS